MKIVIPKPPAKEELRKLDRQILKERAMWRQTKEFDHVVRTTARQIVIVCKKHIPQIDLGKMSCTEDASEAERELVAVNGYIFENLDKIMLYSPDHCLTTKRCLLVRIEAGSELARGRGTLQLCTLGPDGLSADLSLALEQINDDESEWNDTWQAKLDAILHSEDLEREYHRRLSIHVMMIRKGRGDWGEPKGSLRGLH